MQKFHNLLPQKVNKQPVHLWISHLKKFQSQNTTNNYKPKVTPLGIFKINRREVDRLRSKLASNWESQIQKRMGEL